MEKSNILNWLLLIFGLLIIFASIFNWQYFFKLRKAQFLITNFGLTATRVIYALLGILFSFVGAKHLFGFSLFAF